MEGSLGPQWRGTFNVRLIIQSFTLWFQLRWLCYKVLQIYCCKTTIYYAHSFCGSRIQTKHSGQLVSAPQCLGLTWKTQKQREIWNHLKSHSLTFWKLMLRAGWGSQFFSTRASSRGLAQTTSEPRAWVPRGSVERERQSERERRKPYPFHDLTLEVTHITFTYS